MLDCQRSLRSSPFSGRNVDQTRELAGEFLIASGLCWELLTFSNISSRAGWEILTFPLAFQAEQKELAEGTLETTH